METISHKKLTWVHIEQPKAHDISFIQGEFNLHPLIIGKLTSPIYRPQFTEHPDYLFAVVHFPVFDQHGRFKEVGEIDFLINKKIIVTVSSHDSDPVGFFFDQCKKNIDSCERYFKEPPFYLMLIIISQILNCYFDFLDRLAQETDKIESELFVEEESRTLKEISLLQRDIIDVRRVIKPQLPILRSIFFKDEIKGSNFLNLYAQDIIATNIQIWNTLENYWETVNALHRTNNTLLSFKLSRSFNILTALYVTFVPATLIASIFGMNTDVPVIFKDVRLILAIMVGAMGITAVIMLFVMRKKA